MNVTQFSHTLQLLPKDDLQMSYNGISSFVNFRRIKLDHKALFKMKLFLFSYHVLVFISMQLSKT